MGADRFKVRIQKIASRIREKRHDYTPDDTIYKLKLDDWVVFKAICNSKGPISSNEIFASICPKIMKEGQAFMVLSRLVSMELVESQEGKFESHKRAYYTPLVTEQDVLAHCGDLIDVTLAKLEYIFDIEGTDSNG